MRKLMIVSLVGLGIQVVPVAAHAQDSIQHCSPVLQLTGREQSTLATHSLEEDYSYYLDIRARRSSVNMPGYGSGGAAKNSSTISEQEHRRIEQTFAKYDSVFEPAVKAWLSCVSAVSAGLRVIPQLNVADRKSMVITFRPSPGSDNLLQNFFLPPNVTCVSNDGRQGRLGMSFRLPYDRITAFRCTRINDYRGAQEISVLTGRKTYQFLLPALERDYVQYDPTRSSLGVRIGTRGGSATIPVTDFARQIWVQASMRGRWTHENSNGVMTVTINGVPVVSESSGKVPNMQPGGGLKGSDTYILPAFTAGEVRWGCGVTPGDCVSMSGEVRFSTAD